MPAAAARWRAAWRRHGNSAGAGADSAAHPASQPCRCSAQLNTRSSAGDPGRESAAAGSHDIIGSAANNAILVTDLAYSYREGRQQRSVLAGVSFGARSGEIVVISGPSGSGKTTLLSIIGALRSFTIGSVKLHGKELRGLHEPELLKHRHKIGFVFQRHNLLKSLNAVDNVQAGLNMLPGCDGRTAQLRAQAMLESVGLGRDMHKHPDDMSGGQQQRVAVARALARTPDVVIADEPTASLDAEAGRTVMEMIRTLAIKASCAVLISTHDERVFGFADRRLHLLDGRVADVP